MRFATWRRGLFMAAALVLAVCGANFMDPFLYAFRPWSAPAIVLAGIAGLLWSCIRSPRSKLAVLPWLAVPVAVGFAWSSVALDRLAVMSADTDEIAMLGRHFVVGYESADQIEPLVAGGFVGGIVVNRHNAAHRTAAQLRDEIARLRAARRDAGRSDLIVAADQEGGSVSHLSPLLPAMPPLSAIPADAHMMDAAYAYGLYQGLGLIDLGINVDFSPVLDLKSGASSVFDRTSRIAERAISADPNTAGTIGLGYARGLAKAGVIPTAKHFPGLGSIRVDTHVFSASTDAGKSELERGDWIPFRQVLGGSDALLMLGHVTVRAIDPDNPASHSKRVVEGLIRGEWGYHGVLITDDLVMGAIYHHGFCAALVDGLNAGVDLLLIAYDGQQYYRAMSCALDALRRGRIDRTALEESARRLNGLGRRGADS
jgi:beta-N-acetylhexosaminidase